MEVTALLSLRLNIIQVGIVGILFFAVGFWLGQVKIKKMLRRIAKMEKTIMDLNTELLYGAEKSKPTVSRRSAS
jgi:hypothetical protein